MLIDEGEEEEDSSCDMLSPERLPSQHSLLFLRAKSRVGATGTTKESNSIGSSLEKE